MIRIAAFLLLLPCLHSCTTGAGRISAVESLPPLSPDKGRLVAVNSTDGVNVLVIVDGEIQRPLPQGGMISIDLTPGYHRVEFRVPSLSNPRSFQTPNFPPGETLYFAAIPPPTFRSNRAEAVRLGYPVDGAPSISRFGPNTILFRRVSAEEARKIPFRW